MATVEDQSEPYPVWIGEEGHKLHCDQVRLEQYLYTVLNYSVASAAELSQGLARRLADGRSIDDFWAKASFRKTTTEVVRVLLRSIDPISLPTLLCYQDKYGQTGLFQFAVYQRHDVVKLMLDSLEKEEECFKLLRITTKVSERTPLHISCWRSDIVSVKAILDHVNPLQRYDLMKMQTINGNIPLHCAAYCGVTDMLKYLYQSVTKSQWDNLLHMDDHYGLTILHKAAYGGVKTVMTVIKETVSNETFIKLVSTPLPPWDRVKYICRPEKYKQCTENWTVARIEEAIHTVNPQDRAQQIDRITETEPLSIEQIGVLSPHSVKYVIPYNQKKSRRYGLIIFNSHNRPNAAKEASYLKRSLKDAKFKVIKRHWSHSKALYEVIEKALSRLTADCSLLFVCIMAHGSRGELVDSNGAPIAINDVLHHLTIRLSMTLPVVVLIQACQGSQGVQDQASIQTIDHHRTQHIELQRPNTVLLLASKRGGSALRGAFPGAVADVVQVADGITDISAMFDMAAGGVMENQRCIEIGQIPEFRSTMSKLLILPPSSGRNTEANQLPLCTSSIVQQEQALGGKMYGLVLYTTADRDGAIKEAETLSISLEYVGCQVRMMEWYDSSELLWMLETSFKSIAEAGDCSTLIVGLMCHGGAGVLRGGRGHEVPVNSVLKLLNSLLEDTMIPLITMIQACRVTEPHGESDDMSDPISDQVSDPNRDQHITLQRSNSVLLLATTHEGEAKRGAFIDAIASEIKASDGTKDICTIFHIAAGKMLRDSDCIKIGQCPELRKTPFKSLIIPRAEQEEAS